MSAANSKQEAGYYNLLMTEANAKLALLSMSLGTLDC